MGTGGGEALLQIGSLILFQYFQKGYTLVPAPTEFKRDSMLLGPELHENINEFLLQRTNKSIPQKVQFLTSFSQ